VTYYDGNSEQFILGNSDPPLLALTNTFGKNTSTVNLPQYGKLLTFTAYDGVIYALIGADPDIPYLGHLVAMDITTRDSNRLAKVKIDPSKSFKLNAPISYFPQNQMWVTEIQDSAMLIITSSGNQSTIIETKVEGGWDAYWTDVNSNTSVVGYKKGLVACIDPFAGTVKNGRNFGCAGSLAVAFQYQEMYHLSNCGKLVMETIDFNNQTSATVTLDSALASTASIHTAGSYIPYGCGRQCAVDTDCKDCKTCHTCRLGHCIADGQCNSFCIGNEDCYAGVCVGNCEYNRCGRKGCGLTCNNHDECIARSSECQTCRLGRCVSFGNCGSYCQTQQDCYGGSCTNNCRNWRCVATFD